MSEVLTRRYVVEVRQSGQWVAVVSRDDIRDAQFGKDIRTALWGQETRIFDAYLGVAL